MAESGPWVSLRAVDASVVEVEQVNFKVPSSNGM